jgi:hypothetical protein
MNRKTICTATVFLGLMAALVASILIRVPDTVWWWSGYKSVTPSHTPLLLWLVSNVLMPLIVLGMAGSLLPGIWQIAGWICSKLNKAVGDK